MATLVSVFTGFHCTGLWVELAFWILIVWGIPNSLNCISDSKAQDYKIPRTKFTRIPDFTSKHFLDSGIRIPLYIGRGHLPIGSRKSKRMRLTPGEEVVSFQPAGNSEDFYQST